MKVLFPVLQCMILSHSSHPENEYPTLEADSNTIVSDSIVYTSGLFVLFVHQLSTYLIVYSFTSHVAVNVLSHVLHAGIIFHSVHHRNVYHSLLGFFNITFSFIV